MNKPLVYYNYFYMYLQEYSLELIYLTKLNYLLYNSALLFYLLPIMNYTIKLMFNDSYHKNYTTLVVYY